MSSLIRVDDSYRSWVQNIAKRFRQSQIKAALKVNDEMLRFYWSLGRDISERKSAMGKGNEFYNLVSKDLQNLLPDVKSFSPTNLKYMQYFYELYSNPQVADSATGQLSPQVVDLSEMLFSIPWGHHRSIIDKCKSNSDKALFYVRKTLENNWSRAVLLNFLGTNLYERQGKAITSFEMTLPAEKSDLAQAITKGPYNFDFLTIREKYDETELKDALMNNITRLLLELGNGFAFVGREVRIEIGETENYMDMLFYNIKLHSYVVVEVKVKEFESGDMGQLGTYMVAVNHQLKGEQDGPTLGLLICRSKDNVKARYALEASSQPMGISEYDINTFLPEEYKGSMPTIEEIEAELSNPEGGLGA